MINSGGISLSEDSFKASIDQVSITEDMLEADDPRALGDEENPDSEEEWTVFESKEAKMHRELANTFKVNERKFLKIQEKKKRKLSKRKPLKN